VLPGAAILSVEAAFTLATEYRSPHRGGLGCAFYNLAFRTRNALDRALIVFVPRRTVFAFPYPHFLLRPRDIFLVRRLREEEGCFQQSRICICFIAREAGRRLRGMTATPLVLRIIYPTKPTRTFSRASASVFGCAGSCSTLAA
jgi:hypothetical protein